MEYLEQGHLISDLQHGFRQNRSCLSSLLLSTEQWIRALDDDGGLPTGLLTPFQIGHQKNSVYKTDKSKKDKNGKATFKQQVQVALLQKLADRGIAREDLKNSLLAFQKDPVNVTGGHDTTVP
nr:unnamed protein product [Spirometra erinaceieuropaei]